MYVCIFAHFDFPCIYACLLCKHIRCTNMHIHIYIFIFICCAKCKQEETCVPLNEQVWMYKCVQYLKESTVNLCVCESLCMCICSVCGLVWACDFGA